ncbi:MAG: hypothetical protein ACM3U2_15455 [Deltaproteobacteria bacterium]
MRKCILAGLLIATGLAQPARADGLIYQLPEDGGQVRYDMEIAIAGQEQSVKGSMTVSSVGQVMENGEKCRWIELKMITQDAGQDRVAISKALIPEKHLGKGKSAAENMIRAWIKDAETEVVEIRDIKAPQAALLRAFLAGPPRNPGELEMIEIDGKLGKLECAGATGEMETESDIGTIVINVENRLHEKAPFGLVSAVWKFEIKNNGQVAVAGTFKLTLADTGATALTELPDRK